GRDCCSTDIGSSTVGIAGPASVAPAGPNDAGRYADAVNRRSPRTLAVLLGVLVVLLAGIWLGGHPSDLPRPLRDAFVADDDTQLVHEAVDTIDRIYYRKVDKSDLVNRGIEGAVASLRDQFSHYFDPRTYRQFEQVTNPSFSGIGVTVRPLSGGGLAIESVFRGTPAAQAGLQPADRIVAVDGHSLSGRSSNYAIGLIKGQPGTKVQITIARHGRRVTKRLERARVTQPVVAGQIARWHGRR